MGLGDTARCVHHASEFQATLGHGECWAEFLISLNFNFSFHSFCKEDEPPVFVCVVCFITQPARRLLAVRQFEGTSEFRLLKAGALESRTLVQLHHTLHDAGELLQQFVLLQ